MQTKGGAGTTIAPGDSINGGAGTDTLFISVAGDNDNYTLSAVQTESVERVLLNNFDTVNNKVVTVATDLMNGLTTVGLQASAAEGDTAFSGMRALVGAEMRNGAGDLTLTYGSAAVAGSADTQTLTVSNLSAGAFKADGIETIAITTELVKSTLTSVASNKLANVNVTGSKDLTITDALVFAKTANGTAIDGSIDASKFTGKLNVNASGSASTVSILGGSGDDTFAMAATLTKDDVINGGDGFDTVSITGHDGTAATLAMKDLKLTSVEAFEISSTNDKAISVNADGSSVTRYIGVENATTAKAMAFTNLANNTTVALNNTVDGQAIGAVTLGLKDPAGTSDTLNIEVNATSGQADEIITSITTANIETINLKSGFVGSTATVAADVNVITNATFAGAKALNISGSTNLTVSNALGTATGLVDINAAALTGKLSFVAHVGDLNIKGGTNDDTIVMGTTLTAADTIDGGAGKDTLTATINGLGTSAAPSALKIANVETITLNTATAASFINAAGITGATKIMVENDQNVTITNLDKSTTVMLGTLTASANSAVDEYTGTLTVSLADETGTSDTLNIELGATNNDNEINATLKVAATIEKVNIQASTSAATSNDVTLNVADVKSGTIALTKGSAAEVVALGTLATTTTTLDASGFDGVLSVTGSATATNMNVKVGNVANTITLGAGNDTLTLGTLAGDDADGGAGEDTLTATIKGNVTEATTNFETINYIIGNNVQATVTAANGKGTDAAKVFNLSGGDALTTFTHDLVSPAVLTTYNMAAFTGKETTLNVAATAVDLSAVTITGSAGADAVSVTTNNTNFAVKAMTGVETLTINAAAGNTTFDASKTTGIKTIKVDDDNTARVITLSKLGNGTDVEITTGVNATNVVVDLANKADAANSVKVTVGTTVNTVNIDIADVETVNLVNNTGASTVDLAGIAITEAGKFATLNISGNQALTINALNADVNVINASAMTQGGSVVQTSRSGTTAATYTGSAGADTFIMNNAADAINGGSGTDTLDIDFNAILGGIQVDLSSTTDQVTSFNGSANSAVQVGFENVDLSGFTGTFGADITAAATGSTITGTANADIIRGGAGADIITGGKGADSLTGAGGVDTFAFAVGDSSTAIGIFDRINDFLVGTDKLQFTGVTDVESLQQAAVQTAVTNLNAGASAAEIHTAMLLANTTDLGVSFATKDGNTYVLFETTGANTAATAGVFDTTVFIQLTGVSVIPTFAGDVVA